MDEQTNVRRLNYQPHARCGGTKTNLPQPYASQLAMKHSWNTHEKIFSGYNKYKWVNEGENDDPNNT